MMQSAATVRSTSSEFRPRPIRLLPPEVASRIRSTLTITSLPEAISELLQNSLDAQAQNIRININFARNSCIVEDDGHGISPEDLPLIGTQNATSRYTPGIKVSTFGCLGNALASLARHSILTITTRAFTHRSTSSLIFNYSSKPSTIKLAPEHARLQQSGTIVRLDSLFGDFPVRLKSRLLKLDEDKEWEEVKRLVASLLLVSTGSERGPNVSITIRDGGMRKFVLKTRANEFPELEHIRDTSRWELRVLYQLYSVEEVGPSSTWERVRARRGPVSIDGWLCTVGAPSRKYQFISLNHHPLFPPPHSSNALHAELNRFFSTSTFGSVADDPGRPQKVRKPVDKYAKCILRIECARDVEFDELVLGGEGRTETCRTGKGGVEGEYLKTVVNLLQLLIEEFLSNHDLHARATNITIAKCLAEQPRLIPGENEALSAVGIAEEKDLPNNSWNPSTSQPTSNFLDNRETEKGREPAGNSKTIPTTREVFQHEPKPGAPLLAYSSSNSNSRSGNQAPELFSIEGWANKEKSTKHNPIEEKGNLKISQRLSVGQGNTKGDEKENENQQKNTVIAASTGPRDGIAPGLKSANPSVAAGKASLKEKKTITWKNPITQRVSTIDARTGNDISYTPKWSLRKRPYSAFASSSHSCMLPATTQTSSSPLNKRPCPTVDILPEQEKKVDSTFISNVLSSFHNPVFKATEAPIPVLGPASSIFLKLMEESSSFSSNYFPIPSVEKMAENGEWFKGMTGLKGRKLNKEALHNARVVGQVDNKFILVVMEGIGQENEGSEAEDGEIVVMIDQHAADERVKVEKLMAELCVPAGIGVSDEGTGIASKIETILVKPQLSYSISKVEYELLKGERYKKEFAGWGILYTLPTVLAPADGGGGGEHKRPTITSSMSFFLSSACTEQDQSRGNGLAYNLLVTHLPQIVLDRCSTEPLIALDLVRSHLWDLADGKKAFYHLPSCPCPSGGVSTAIGICNNQKGNDNIDHDWLNRMGYAPRKLIEIVNSRACRSAIMFNDVLTWEECVEVKNKLSRCRFPFQCAHGRPGLVPLLGLEEAGNSRKAGALAMALLDRQGRSGALGGEYGFSRDGFGKKEGFGPLGYAIPQAKYLPDRLTTGKWGFKEAYREWKERRRQEGESKDQRMEVKGVGETEHNTTGEVT